MENLLDILYKETQSLKEQFLTKRENWAKEYYETCKERKTWNEENWAKYLGVPTRIANEGTSMAFVSFHTGFYNSSASKRYNKLRVEASKVITLGLEKFVEKEIKNATDHYETSIKKLAERIVKKDLNINNLKTRTSHIGVNIETVLTDGVKIIKAWTIIAEGEIQQPHYRYLVK